MQNDPASVWKKLPKPTDRPKQPANIPSKTNTGPRSTAPQVSQQNAGYSNLERFGAISKQHQAGISRKLEELKQTMGEDESDSDEDPGAVHKDEIIENMVKNYANQAGGGDDGLLQKIMTNATSSGSWTCLVCISSLKRADAVWNCNNCAACFHLSCIQKWAKDGVIITSQFLSEEHFPEKDRFWACPKCRHEFPTRDAPTRYYCFCEKTVDPPNDPWLLPHSCGQICQKVLKSGCNHKCLLLCHPGPCPPCPAQCRVACFCGKQQTMMRCGGQAWACGKSCGQLLACGKHSCQKPCHPGDCGSCEKTVKKACVCGAETAVVLCGIPEWHCEKVCGRKFGCEIHSCGKKCHTGDCGPCLRSLPRSCPCGKTRAVTDCSAEVLPCGNTCGKPVCQRHSCLELCHTGDCGPCMQATKRTCPCGSKTKQLPCSKEFVCDTKCKSQRNCGRHMCNKRCCIGNCPPCDQVCARMLNCRSHKCDSLCHSGQCYPCSQTVDVFCGCGQTKMTVPCGRQRSIKPPKCSRPCQVPPDCHHPYRTKHGCHFGKCPTCYQVCGRNLQCSHQCQAKCHSAVEVRITSDKDRPAGPWDLKVAPDMEIRDLPCPPCEQLVLMPCLGGHDQAPMKCCEKRILCCGRKCGQFLECGNHMCSLECHELGDSTKEEKYANCESCTSLCSFRKPCGHPCIMPCHPGPSCSPCSEVIRVKCHCQSMVLRFSCSKLVGITEEDKKEMFSCKIQCSVLMTCGHPCQKLCHPPNVPHNQPEDCKKKVAVSCACGRQKEQHPCSKVMKGFSIKCDEMCRVQAEEKEKEEKMKAQLVLEAKQKAELDLQEQYDRKQRGRNKRPRNRNDYDEDEGSFFSLHWKKVAVGLVAAVVVSYLVHLMV